MKLRMDNKTSFFITFDRCQAKRAKPRQPADTKISWGGERWQKWIVKVGYGIQSRFFLAIPRKQAASLSFAFDF